MKKSRCLKLILALPILVLITFAGFVSPFGFVLHAHAASLATGAEPIWALPFPTGTSISIGPFGLHGDNFGSMVDKRTGQVFTFDNQTDNDSLDVLLEPVQPQGTATIPTTSLASGTVLAVWPECQLILIDHGHGWWAVYLHLVSIQVTSGDS